MKKILTVLLVLAVTGGTAFAQFGPDWTNFNASGDLNLPVGILGAPSSVVTEGIWAGQWHNIMSPSAHSGVSFENWTGFAAFGEGDAPGTTNRFAMAYATRIGGMYLAAYLGGTGFGLFRNLSFTEFRSNSWTSDPDNWRTFREYDMPNFNTGTNNRIAVLIGIADMGFRLSYGTTVNSFSSSNVYDLMGYGEYLADVSAALGVRQIELMWAMSRNLLDIGLRPTAGIRLNFARNFSEFNEFEYDGSRVGNIIAHSANFIQPEIELNSGWVNFFTTDSGWLLRADLQYELAFRMFNNDFTIYDTYGNPSGTRSISGIHYLDVFGPGNDIFYEMSWMRHRIRPRVQLNWTGETVALSTRLVLDNWITSSSQDERSWNDYYDGITSNFGTNESTFRFQFQPSLEFAVRWFALPNRLTLQAGARYDFGSITRETVETTPLDSYGNSIANGTFTTTSIDFSQASTRFRVGATFHFNENFALDAATSVQNGANVNFFPTTGNNGLMHFTSVMGVLTF